jgi:DNA-binding XRE family transcriptional regulator
MNKARKERLERAGWKVGTASELLGLTDAEAALVEAKLRLGDVVRTLRRRHRLSQAALAKLMGSSQSRVAKMENQDPEVSLDLQMKAIFAASPDARRDFQGLIRRWSAGRRRPRRAATVEGMGGRD